MALVLLGTGCGSTGSNPTQPSGVTSTPASVTPTERGGTPSTTATEPGGAPTEAPATQLTGRLLLARSNELIVRDVATGTEQTIASADGANFLIDPIWSHDGSHVAYAVQLTLDPSVDNDYGSDLYLADADGGNAKLVAKHAATGDFYRFPSFSPDGSTLYFSRSRVDESTGSPNPIFEIAALNLASGAVAIVADKAYGGEVSRDGKSYVFVDLEGGGQQLSVLDLATGKKRVLVTPKDGLALYYAPRFSPDDKRLVFAGSGDIGKIPSVRTLGDGGLVDRLRDWLDGSTAEADGPPWDLYIVHLQGEPRLRRLTEVYDDQPYPAWIGDGTGIVYVGITGLVYLADDKSREPVKLAEGVLHAQLDWVAAP